MYGVFCLPAEHVRIKNVPSRSRPKKPLGINRKEPNRNGGKNPPARACPHIPGITSILLSGKNITVAAREIPHPL